MRNSVDIVSVILIILGIIILSGSNNLGWLFVGGGILKWALGKWTNKIKKDWTLEQKEKKLDLM